MFNKYKLLGISALFIITSCDFEEINTNPYQVTPEMGKMDGIAMGGPILAMQRYVFPVGTQADGTNIINEYQSAYHLSADVWSGYFAQDNNWESGNNNCTYYILNRWCGDTYECSYTNIFAEWREVKLEAEKSDAPEVFALAQILKISAWHKALESFGPIPYSHALDASIVIPFDSEEEVYDSMFSDLKSAIEELKPLAEAGGKVMADYDAVYGGNAEKWVKYANSLMLRLAIRLKYIAPDKSKKWITEALNHSIGVMKTKTDEAQMSSGAGYTFVNNIAYLADQYDECRMGTSMYAYLVGYEDPRLSKYFSPCENENWDEVFDGNRYAPVPSGNAESHGTYKDYSLPNMTSSTPTYWMRASEVYFLRAEAALKWPEFGSAEDLYHKGIEMSFEENGIAASSVEAYLNSQNEPISVSVHETGYSASKPTSATTAFKGNDNEKLEKIIIQKWIALYPNGQEAWTEFRRTGFPKLNEVENNRGQAQGITASRGIRRMPYPESFYSTDEGNANYQEALRKMKDKQDTPIARLWWDCN